MVVAHDSSVVSCDPNSCHRIKAIRLTKEMTILLIFLSPYFLWMLSKKQKSKKNSTPLLILQGLIHHHQHRRIYPEQAHHSSDKLREAIWCSRKPKVWYRKT
jgi:hypothetical protein